MLTIADRLCCARRRRQAHDVLAGLYGTACFSGRLSNQWTVRDFSPNEYLPKGVRLAGYSGDAGDLPAEAFQEILDAVAAGRLAFPVDRVYDGLEQVPQAHDDMEHDRATGKLVVRVRHQNAN
jgi:NADPH:quinone reductase